MIILNEFNEACLKFEILTVFSFDLELISLLCTVGKFMIL